MKLDIMNCFVLRDECKMYFINCEALGQFGLLRYNRFNLLWLHIP